MIKQKEYHESDERKHSKNLDEVAPRLFDEEDAERHQQEDCKIEYQHRLFSFVND